MISIHRSIDIHRPIERDLLGHDTCRSRLDTCGFFTPSRPTFERAQVFAEEPVTLKEAHVAMQQAKARDETQHAS